MLRTVAKISVTANPTNLKTFPLFNAYLLCE